MEKSFLKWAGGKFRVLPHLLPILDSLVDSHIKDQTFIEPFLGSGTVFLNFNKVNNFILSDKNNILISLFQELQNNPKNFIKKSEKLFDGNNFKENYIEIVELFNQETSLKKKAALFIYLNKHCFNGLMRFNNSGKFNTPFGGAGRNPTYPMNEILNMVKKIESNKVVFMNRDFRDLLNGSKFGDIVYCDPPYYNTFTQYGKGGFSFEDQEELASLAYSAAIRGAKVVVSNSFSKETKKLYKDASYLEIIDIRRSISSDKTTRGDVKELIAVYDF